MPIDYSKWKNIEVSDDEDDTHPNIDNASLFRWRHQARVERMREMEEKKKHYATEKEKAEAKLKAIKERLEKEGQESGDLKKAEAELEVAQSKWDEITQEERLQPWNVDTISKPKWEKTIINKPQKVPTAALTEEEQNKRYNLFIEKYEDKIKEFGMLSKWEDCRKFLLEHTDLCCEETSNYLTVWCLNLEIEEKSSLMEHVAKQAIAMQYMLELAKQLDVDVRSCISSFFQRIQNADQHYVEAFNDEIEAFKKRVRDRAEVRRQMALQQLEEEEKKNRLGPGGLDPLDVIETLPEDLRECFETHDLDKLKEVLEKMDPKDAQLHMKRCIDSGLWVPDANANDEDTDASDKKLDGTDEESTYAECGDSSKS